MPGSSLRNRGRRRIVRAVSATFLGALPALLVFFFEPVVEGDGLAPFSSLVATLPPIVGVLLPLISLVIALLLARRGRVAAASVVGIVALCALGAVLSGPMEFGKKSATVAADSTPRCRLLILNVEKWEYGGNAIAGLIAREKPDLVCLQEAGDYDWQPDPNKRPSALLAALPGYEFARADEILILWRRDSVEKLSVERRTLPAVESRPALILTAKTAPGVVRLASVHLLPSGNVNLWPVSAAVRLAQARSLVQAFSSERDNTVIGEIVAGDFNANPFGAPGRVLRDAGFVDLSAGLRATCPSTFPWYRYDQVWSRGAIAVEQSDVPADRVSDHRAILIDFVRPSTTTDE